MPLRPDVTLDKMKHRGDGRLPGLVGFRVVDVQEGLLHAELDIRPELLAPNGYLHAAVVIALADTASGYGCLAHLPEGAQNFTTIELKANFFSTAREGTIVAKARARAHGQHDAGVGRRSDAQGGRQADRALPLHAARALAEGVVDPASAHPIRRIAQGSTRDVESRTFASLRDERAMRSMAGLAACWLSPAASACCRRAPRCRPIRRSSPRWACARSSRRRRHGREDCASWRVACAASCSASATPRWRAECATGRRPCPASGRARTLRSSASSTICRRVSERGVRFAFAVERVSTPRAARSVADLARLVRCTAAKPSRQTSRAFARASAGRSRCA